MVELETVDALPVGFDVSPVFDDGHTSAHIQRWWIAYYETREDDPADLGAEIMRAYEANGRRCLVPEDVDALREIIRARRNMSLS